MDAGAANGSKEPTLLDAALGTNVRKVMEVHFALEQSLDVSCIAHSLELVPVRITNVSSDKFNLSRPLKICKKVAMKSNRSNLFLDGKALPENLFSKVFRSYLFFDELSPAVKAFEGAAADWVDRDQKILINSVLDQGHNDFIRWSDGLSEKSDEFRILQEKNDDLFGQNICSLDKSWAIHHYSPVSLGVLALDTQKRQIMNDLHKSGWFITSVELVAKFHSEGPAMLDLSYGSGFARILMQEFKLNSALDSSK